MSSCVVFVPGCEPNQAAGVLARAWALAKDVTGNAGLKVHICKVQATLTPVPATPLQGCRGREQAL